jgi:hypothetical protein
MSGSTDPPDADIEETNQRLTEGLTSCRSVVKNYRALIGGEETAATDADQGGPGRKANSADRNSSGEGAPPDRR